MTDIFSDENALAAVKKEASEAQTASDDLTNVLTQAQSDLQTRTESFNKAIGVITSNEQQITDNLQDTLEKSEFAARLPPKLSRIMGLFNADFSQDALRVRAAKHNAQLNAQGRKKTALKRQFSSDLALIEQQVKTSTALAGKEQGDFTRQVAVAQFGFDLKNQQHVDMLRKVDKLSQEELENGLKDPEALGLPAGLIQTELTKRNAQKLGVDLQSIQVEATNLALNKTKKDDFLKSQTPDDLEKLLKLDIRNRPEQVTNQEILTAKATLEQRALAVASSKLALQTKNLEAVENIKKTFLNTLSARELGIMSKQSQTGKPFVHPDMPNIEFSQIEIQRAHAARIKEESDIRDQFATTIAQTTALDSMIDSVGETSKTLAAANGGSLPPALQARHQATVLQLTAQKQLGASANAQLDVANKFLEDMKETQEALVKNAPDTRKDALNEWFQTGNVQSTAAAAKNISGMANNETEFVDNLILNAPWVQFQQTYQQVLIDDQARTQTIQVSKDDEDGSPFSVVTSRPAKDEETLVAKAMKDSNFKNRVGRNMFVHLALQTIQKKILEGGDLGPQRPFNPYDLLWDHQNNTIAAEVLTRDSSGALFIDLNRLNQYISDTVNPRLRETGLLTANQTFQEILSKDMSGGFGEFFARNFTDENSPEMASVARMAAGGDFKRLFNEARRVFNNNVLQTEKNAEFTRQQQEKIRQIPSTLNDPNTGP